MAGHSKWANIRARKGVQDAKRGKIFTKYIREITVAARAGGADPGHNPRLRTAIDKALAQNMPKDNIERAIRRGGGESDGVHFEDALYEGYAPGGAAVLVECATDNRNRTAGEVRHTFAKNGGNLGTDGSVSYLFKKFAVFHYPPDTDEDRLLEAALEAGALDLTHEAGAELEVLAPPEGWQAVGDALAARGFPPVSSELVRRPMTAAPLAGDDAERTMKLLEALDDLDDVQNVITNAEFPDELMTRLQG